MDTVVYQGCLSSDVDATTGVCAHPVWITQPGLFPPLDIVSAVTIAIAIIACWALAYGYKTLQRVGD